MATNIPLLIVSCTVKSDDLPTIFDFLDLLFQKILVWHIIMPLNANSNLMENK